MQEPAEKAAARTGGGWPTEFRVRHEVWVVRHGQSGSNAGLPTAGPGLSELTALGRRQAASMAGILPREPDLVVASAYARSLQTAQAVLERFPAASFAQWPIHEFTYLAPHRYAGSTMGDRRPHVEGYWARCDPAWRDGPGAESFNDMLARVDACLERLAAGSGLTVAVAHGQIMRAILWRCYAQGGAAGGGSAADADGMARFRALRAGVCIPNAAVLRLCYGAAGEPLLSPILTGHLADGFLSY